MKTRFLLSVVVMFFTTLLFGQSHHFFGGSHSLYGFSGINYFQIKDEGLGYWTELKSDIIQYDKYQRSWRDPNQYYTRHINYRPHQLSVLSGGLTFRASNHLALYFGSGITITEETFEYIDNYLHSKVEDDQSFVSELNLSGGLALLLFNSRMLVTLGFNGTPVDVSLGFSIGLPF